MGAQHVMDKGYSETLDSLIIAFCRDYGTRARAIEERSCKRRTLMEYEYINRRLRDAASEIVGYESELYIDEIGKKIGYAYSGVCGISETEYKVKKKEVKLNIAKKLHLLD